MRRWKSKRRQTRRLGVAVLSGPYRRFANFIIARLDLHPSGVDGCAIRSLMEASVTCHLGTCFVATLPQFRLHICRALVHSAHIYLPTLRLLNMSSLNKPSAESTSLTCPLYPGSQSTVNCYAAFGSWPTFALVGSAQPALS
jgi:hypothetical protein